ncbi:hypothetical protein [Proteus mirabilis]|uniref:hypothetical protein n=1 Tax=Proteus mirabilis TaxID=584 RepID=UPI001EF2F5D1|nr:hypothetical protein [Proteus mirabilis]
MLNKEANILKIICYKAINIVLKLIPCAIIISGLIIWFYLNSIDRLDLLIDSFSIYSALLSLLVFSAILSFLIALILILPSSILILYRSNFQNKIGTRVHIPIVSLIVNVILLTLLLSNLYPSNNETLSSNLYIIISILLSLAGAIIISILNNNFKLKTILVTLFDSIIISLSTLSFSIPFVFLLRDISGEKTISLLIVLLLMFAFTSLSLLPAIIFYNEKESQDKNILSIIKKTLIGIITAIIFTFLLFPSLTIQVINISLYSIGFIDNKNHYFLINGTKYQPNMFPTHLWNTSTHKEIKKDFFIYGIRLFSTGSNNLICPSKIGEMRSETKKTNYDLIISSGNNNKIKELKNMTSLCVVMLSEDAKQWDNFFEKE